MLSNISLVEQSQTNSKGSLPTPTVRATNWCDQSGIDSAPQFFANSWSYLCMDPLIDQLAEVIHIPPFLLLLKKSTVLLNDFSYFGLTIPSLLKSHVRNRNKISPGDTLDC